MSDPFRDDQEAQLARANALAIENEQLKRERDELKAKLEASSAAHASETKRERDEIKAKLEALLVAHAPETAPTEVRKTTSRLTFHIHTGHHIFSNREITLDGPVVKIGRVASAHLRLEHASISRMHAIIEALSVDTACVIDLGSMTGTFVNGQKVTKARIKTGDVLRIGDLDMSLTIVDVPLHSRVTGT